MIDVHAARRLAQSSSTGNPRVDLHAMGVDETELLQVLDIAVSALHGADTMSEREIAMALGMEMFQVGFVAAAGPRR